MKDWQYHLLNSAIAGILVFLGSLSSILSNDFNLRSMTIGIILGFITGLIVFLNKINDWLKTTDRCHKNLKMINFL